MTVSTAEPTLTIRALTRDDLPAVVAIDAAIEGRPRRDYVQRRLSAALREPALHAQFAAVGPDGLVGYILGSVLEGEFGRAERGLRLEMVGVRADARGRHGGTRLFEALSEWARRRDVAEVRTAANWHDAQMLRWLDAMKFQLAPAFILGASLADAARRRAAEPEVTVPSGHGPGSEINFGTGEANDNERLASEQPEVRSMRPEDLREIVRIDQRVTGRDRSGYIGARLAEAMDDSAIRVSLAARLDGAIIGFVMARADLGDFGRAEPVAVVDTIGVDPEYAHRGVGRALLTQLFANLAELQIEQVETVLSSTDMQLLGFFQKFGLRPLHRLAFARRLDNKS